MPFCYGKCRGAEGKDDRFQAQSYSLEEWIGSKMILLTLIQHCLLLCPSSDNSQLPLERGSSYVNRVAMFQGNAWEPLQRQNMPYDVWMQMDVATQPYPICSAKGEAARNLRTVEIDPPVVVYAMSRTFICAQIAEGCGFCCIRGLLLGRTCVETKTKVSLT
jgi:hypothetical protein